MLWTNYCQTCITFASATADLHDIHLSMYPVKNPDGQKSHNANEKVVQFSAYILMTSDGNVSCESEPEGPIKSTCNLDADCFMDLVAAVHIFHLLCK